MLIREVKRSYQEMVNVDTFFTDDDGTEYNEDLVTLEQFMSRLEM